MTFAEAAALAANGPLAWLELELGGVGPGTPVLIPGASGGVGSTLVALASRRGAHVVALARNRTSHEAIRSLGAAAVLDSERKDLADAIWDATDDKGIEVALDNLTLPDTFAEYATVLRNGARIICGGSVGAEPLSFDPRVWYMRGYSFIGARTASRAETRAFWDEVIGGFRLPDDVVASFGLEHASEAHSEIERGRRIGSYVLTP
jgi:NADPH:quinone reductase-like Zn-dependent oxidoreductase